MSLVKRSLIAVAMLSVAAALAPGSQARAQATATDGVHDFHPRVCVDQLAASLAELAPSKAPAPERIADIAVMLREVQAPAPQVRPQPVAERPFFATRKALREAAINPPAVQPINIDYIAETLTVVAALNPDAPISAPEWRVAQLEDDPHDIDAPYREPVEVEAMDPPAETIAAEEALVQPVVEQPVMLEQPAAEMETLPRPTVLQPAPASADVMIVGGPVQRSITPLHLLDQTLAQPITANFRDTDITDVLAILARRAGVNVVGGTVITGKVTLYLKDVPLRQAMELALQQNNLGIIQEGNVFRIVTLREAQQANRISRTVYLQNADTDELSTTLEAVIVNTMDAALTSISTNKTTRALIISGPTARVNELVTLAYELDVAEPALPTVTEAIHLNYAEPIMVKPVIESMLTPQVGNVETDMRSRTVIVTDVPVVIEQVRAMLVTIDRPVKQVGIHAMLVDVVLRDSSAMGTQWILDLVRRRSRSGQLVGNLENLTFGTNLGNVGAESLNAGILNVGVIGRGFDLQASIAAETASGNSEILANPMVVTVENKPATISIVQEFPYQEITQTTQGPPVASTSFKDIGITLDVTPRVTNDNHVIVELAAKQSSVSGLTQDGIPIEDKREAQTTLRVADNETIFIGGLRNVSDRIDVSKVPLLGDIPVINFMFRNTDSQKINTELMIFLTCNILGESLPLLTADQEIRHNAINTHPRVPNAEQVMFRNFTHPDEMRDPMWKWRRPE